MSVAVETVSASKTTPCVCPNNMKEEEQKSGKLDKLVVCELKEKPAKTSDFNKDETRAKEDNNACSKSQLETGVSPCKQVEYDKADENESKCKQQNMEKSSIEAVENKGAEVKILSLTVLSPGREDVVLGIPFPSTTSKSTLFTLKEGSKYRIKFHFMVSHKVVTSLTYSYMVWKAGIRVHQTKKLIGTFSPRQEPYTFELEEGTTPTGFFARGPFFVRSKFGDDDGNCYLDTTYYFDIRKDWGARDKC